MLHNYTTDKINSIYSSLVTESKSR